MSKITFCAAKHVQHQKIGSNNWYPPANCGSQNHLHKTNISTGTESDYLAQLNRETRDAGFFKKIIKTIKALYRANRPL